MSRRSLSLVLALLAPAPLLAADVPVTYLVDAKGLKSATATTPLTFTLSSDAACTSTVTTQVINAGDLDVIEQLKRLFAKPAPKPPTTARITTKITGVTKGGNLFLTVTGTGVTPFGGACQAQTAHAAGPRFATVPGVTVAASGHNFLVSPSVPPYHFSAPFAGRNGENRCLLATDRESVSVLATLSQAVLHTCDLEADIQDNDMVAIVGDCGFLFSVSNCTDLPASCSDGIKNQNETSPDCGGVCPPCVDGLACAVGADCESGHCRAIANGPPCIGLNGTLRCTPAHCFDGVKNGGEGDIDCGFACDSACSAGQSCISNHTDCSCASGLCSGSLCQ